jgi:hypothetical protein
MARSNRLPGLIETPSAGKFTEKFFRASPDSRIEPGLNVKLPVPVLVILRIWVLDVPTTALKYIVRWVMEIDGVVAAEATNPVVSPMKEGLVGLAERNCRFSSASISNLDCIVFPCLKLHRTMV